MAMLLIGICKQRHCQEAHGYWIVAMHRLETALALALQAAC